LPGSGALRGRGSKLVVLLVLGVLVLSLVLPLVIESLIAERLQAALETSEKPDVEVSSSFPPEMLLGRIDEVQVTMAQPNASVVLLEGVRVYVPSLIAGNPEIEADKCSTNVDYKYITDQIQCQIVATIPY